MSSSHRPIAGQGFTLIELMIAVAIVAILAAVAVPQYSAYVMRSRVPDATSALATKQVQIEQYFLDNRTYVGAPACTNDSNTSKYFNFACSAVNATGFTLTATGKSNMTGFSYTVNQAGAKTTTVPVDSGWTGSTTCWVTKKDGTC